MSPDDIKPGMYLAVSKRECTSLGMFGFSQQEPEYSGVPFKVLAISLPFISVANAITGNVSSIDVRDWEVIKLSKQYVNSFVGNRVNDGRCVTVRTSNRKRKRKPDVRDCPR